MALRPTRPFAYFAVLSSTSGQSAEQDFQVLHRFPKHEYEDCLFPDSLAAYCFPVPMKVSTRKERGKFFHTFVLNEDDGNRLYGGCLSWVQEGDGSAEAGCELQVVAICLLSHWPVLGAIRSSLFALEAAQTNPQLGATPLEAWIVHLVHELPMPEPDVGIEFSVGASKAFLSRPGPSRLPQADLPLGVLFKHLDFPNLFATVTAVAIERRIVVHCPDVSVLTPFCEALLSLVFPLRWAQLYIPVLPDALLDLAATETPYLLGVSSASLESMGDLPEETIVVDLWHNRVIGVEGLPELNDPSARELVQTLCVASTMFADQPAPPPENGDQNSDAVLDAAAAEPQQPHRVPTAKEIRATTMVRGAFLQFFVRLLSNYRPYIVANALSIGSDINFRMPDFIASLAPEQRQLANQLCATTAFAEFVTMRVAATSVSQRQLVALFDDCIEAYVARDDHDHAHAVGRNDNAPNATPSTQQDVTVTQSSVAVESSEGCDDFYEARRLCSDVKVVPPPLGSVLESDGDVAGAGGVSVDDSDVDVDGGGDCDVSLGHSPFLRLDQRLLMKQRVRSDSGTIKSAETSTRFRSKRRLSLEQSLDAARDSQHAAVRRLLLAETTRLATALSSAIQSGDDDRTSKMSMVMGMTLAKVAEHGMLAAGAADKAADAGGKSGVSLLKRLLRKRVEAGGDAGGTLWGIIDAGAAECKGKDNKALRDAASRASRQHTSQARVGAFCMAGAQCSSLASWMKSILLTEVVSQWIESNLDRTALLRHEDCVFKLLQELNRVDGAKAAGASQDS